MDQRMTTTTMTLDGYRVVETLGVVRGISVRSRGIIGAAIAKLHMVVGGNITVLTHLCERTREEAFEILMLHAERLGANAVLAVRYDGTAKANACASYTGTTGAKNVGGVQQFTCNPDFNVSQLGVITRWTPVKNLTFSAEVGAFFLDQKFTGAATLAAAAPKPTTVYEFKDQSTVYLNVRAQRNF